MSWWGWLLIGLGSFIVLLASGGVLLLWGYLRMVEEEMREEAAELDKTTDDFVEQAVVDRG